MTSSKNVSSDGLAVIAIFLMTLAIGFTQMAIGVCGVNQDDAIYVSTARTLADGEGYRLASLPESPPQTKFPILYPALLALIWKIWPSFPENLIAMQLMSLAVGSFFLAIAYFYLVRFGYTSRPTAFASCLVCLTSPMFLYYTTNTLSEMFFAVLALAMFWHIEAVITGASAKSKREQILTGVLLGLPALCRSIGLAFIPVGLFLLYRNKRPMKFVASGAIATILPWFIWSANAVGVWHKIPIVEYDTDYWGWWAQSGLPSLGVVLAKNILWIASNTMEAMAQGFSHWVSSRVVLIIPGLLIWVVIVRDYKRVLSAFLLSYLALVLFWPWPPLRFLIPLFPFIVASGLALISKLLKAMPLSVTARRTLLITGLFSILILPNLLLTMRFSSVIKNSNYPYRAIPHNPVQWSSYQDVFGWLKANTDPSDILAAGLDKMVYLYTSRKSFRPITGSYACIFYGINCSGSDSVDAMVGILKKYYPRYLVNTPMPYFAEEKAFSDLIDEVRRRYPGWMEPVYTGSDNRFVVYRFRDWVTN